MLSDRRVPVGGGRAESRDDQIWSSVTNHQETPHVFDRERLLSAPGLTPPRCRTHSDHPPGPQPGARVEAPQLFDHQLWCRSVRSGVPSAF